MKPGSNPVEDHPQLSHNGHPMDDTLVGAGSLGLPLPMCKAFTYLVVTYFPTYLYMGPASLLNGFTKVKPDINSVEVHPQLSYITVNTVDDGALGGDVLLPDWTPTPQLYDTTY
jgi:hypothetical protein